MLSFIAVQCSKAHPYVDNTRIIAVFIDTDYFTFTKKVKDDNINIVRFSNAEIIANVNALSLEYLYFITDSQKDKKGYPITIEVNEKMRYFTQLELNYYFDKAGFKVLNYYNYMTKNILLEHEWNGLVIVEKFKSI